MANKPYDPLRRSRYISALRAALGEGEKLAHAAALIGVSVPHASRICVDAGIRRIWTTEDEREALAALRSGHALVVHAAAAPACARLVEQIDSALRGYRTSISARRQNLGTAAPAVAANREAAGECLRADPLSAPLCGS